MLHFLLVHVWLIEMPEISLLLASHPIYDFDLFKCLTLATKPYNCKTFNWLLDRTLLDMVNIRNCVPT